MMLATRIFRYACIGVSGLVCPLLSVTPKWFLYWDGERIRCVNPRRPGWILETELPAQIRTNDEITIALRVARKAFQAPQFEDSTGTGLTDVETAKLLRRFWKYTGAITRGESWLSRLWRPEGTR